MVAFLPTCLLLGAAAAETAIGRDPVDVRIRNALSPIINPILSALARRPLTANVTAAAAGPGTPLVSPCSMLACLITTSGLSPDIFV